MLLLRLTLWVTAFAVVAASLAFVAVGVTVLVTEGGPLGGAIFLGAILAGLGLGGPYVAYLLVRVARRLRGYRPKNPALEFQVTAVLLLGVLVAVVATPLPGNPPFGVRVIAGVVLVATVVIALADSLERERREDSPRG